MPRNKHAEVVHSYDDVFLACRDLRHVWQVVGFYRLPGGLVRRVLDCARCGTQRADKWRTNGEREPSGYSYVDGYQLSGGFDTWEVRKEVMSRATIYKDEREMIAALSSGGTPRVRRSSRPNGRKT